MIVQAVEGNGGGVYYMKGALEGVLVKCDSYLEHGYVRPLANTNIPAVAVRHAAELGTYGKYNIYKISHKRSELPPYLWLLIFYARSTNKSNFTLKGLSHRF
jgi:hypothetical protein